MLNACRFKDAKEVWRKRKGVLERGYRFKLKEHDACGTWSTRRKHVLTYWTKEDAWSGVTADAKGERSLKAKECVRVAKRFELVV